jgi:ATPase family associated with various cellular activities (AAA)
MFGIESFLKSISNSVESLVNLSIQNARIWLVRRYVLVLGLLSFTPLAYVSYIAYEDEKKLKNTLKFGNRPSVDIEKSVFIDRPTLSKELKAMLSPKPHGKCLYYVISGEHGTGKTSMIKKVCNEIGSGVIYVDVPDDVNDFEKAFASATGFDFRENTGIQKYIHGLVYKNNIAEKKGSFTPLCWC